MRAAEASVAVARKLVVVMHAMWTDGTLFVGGDGLMAINTLR